MPMLSSPETPAMRRERHAVRLRLLPLLLCVLVAGACFRRQGNVPAQEPASLAVENQNFLDADIFVLRGGERIRIGTVTGQRTATFTIPPNLIFGMSTLQFRVHPIGATRDLISASIQVGPGDEVRLTISPTGNLFVSKS